MTGARYRNWSALHRAVAFGESDGRIIWQPRLGPWYTEKKFYGEALPQPYEGKSVPDIYRALGCSDRLYESFNPCFREVEPPEVHHISTYLGDGRIQHAIVTPVGTQIEITRSVRNSWYVMHEKREIASEDDLRVATWREEHTTWEWEQAHFERSRDDVGDLGAPTVTMPRMNVQELCINRMGRESAIFAIHDWPKSVEAFFKAREENHERLIDVINVSPIEIISFAENVHSATLSPDLFEKYHLPACRRRCDLLHAGGKFVSAHWDGSCGPLLPLVRRTGLDALEAITPAPQGDTSIEDIRRHLGDDMFLMDGIPAIFFDASCPVQTLVDYARHVIELFAPRLILGISDEMSATGEIERVRIVGELVEEYNQRCAAAPPSRPGMKT
jgi:hypothetical protein